MLGLRSLYSYFAANVYSLTGVLVSGTLHLFLIAGVYYCVTAVNNDKEATLVSKSGIIDITYEDQIPQQLGSADAIEQPKIEEIKPQSIAKPIKHQVKKIIASNTQQNASAQAGISIADSIGDIGYDAPAQAIGVIKPVYPALSRLNQEEGGVSLLVTIDDQGIVQDLKIRSSSEFLRLDRAAFEALQKSRFLPARQKGKAIVSKRIITFKFRLQ